MGYVFSHICPLVSSISEMTFRINSTQCKPKGRHRAALYRGGILRVKKIEDTIIYFYIMVFPKKKKESKEKKKEI